MVASGNADAHLKNWALVYPDGVRPVLSPLYDQVATIAWPEVDSSLALKLAGTRDPSRVNLDSFRRLARKASIDEDRALEAVRETLERTLLGWGAVEAKLPVEHRAAVVGHWSRVPLLRDAGFG